jgi:tetratricopeptide (TPR) repeat protein
MSGMIRPLPAPRSRRLPSRARAVAQVAALGLAGLALLALAPASTTRAEEAVGPFRPTHPEAHGTPEAIAALREIVARQKAALAEAREKDDAVELEDVRPRLQKVIDDYERLLSRHPHFAAGWTAYGLFLCDPVVEDRKAALALLLRANTLDGEIPVVKNQLGVILAEQGRVIDAFNYFLAAADLAPTEPLYHFQIGLLLSEARGDFLKTQAWRAADLDKTMLSAFARAVTLAPDRTDYAYRAAEAYYDLAEPRWEEAYQAWTALEERLSGRLETQTVRLHRARVLWKQGLAGDARELLASVTAPELAGQRARLAEEFAAEEAAEAEAAASVTFPGAPTPPGAVAK